VGKRRVIEVVDARVVFRQCAARQRGAGIKLKKTQFKKMVTIGTVS